MSRALRREIRQAIALVGIAVYAATISGCDFLDPHPHGAWDRPPASELIASHSLSVAPVFQNTQLWCWLASGEMVFRYYNVPAVNPLGYQCGVVGILYPFQCGINCGNCIVGAGSWANVAQMIVNYPVAAQSFFGRPNRQLSVTPIDAPLSDADVLFELDNGRPILVGIDPSGFRVTNQNSEHVAVIIGYEKYKSQLRFIVNDPWPYQAPAFFGRPDPYVDAGGELLHNSPQYSIASEAFRSRLQWGQTIYHIQ